MEKGYHLRYLQSCIFSLVQFFSCTGLFFRMFGGCEGLGTIVVCVNMVTAGHSIGGMTCLTSGDPMTIFPFQPPELEEWGSMNVFKQILPIWLQGSDGCPLKSCHVVSAKLITSILSSMIGCVVISAFYDSYLR